MPSHRVLILGGGFGGIAAAVALRGQLDPADEIVLVERRPTFVMGLRKNWAVLDPNALIEGERPLALLADGGIRVVTGTIGVIHPGERAVEVDGDRWDADALVVALGAERDPDRVPGFRERAIDVYDLTQGDRARAAIEAFTGGRLVIGIFGAPYPCPPAPFELAMLIDERLRARGIRGAIEVFSPLPLACRSSARPAAARSSPAWRAPASRSCATTPPLRSTLAQSPSAILGGHSTSSWACRPIGSRRSSRSPV